MAVYDSEFITIGSCNWTHNGVENNKEHVVRIKAPSINWEAAADFERTWEVAQAVDAERMEETVRRAAAKAAEKAARKLAPRNAKSEEPRREKSSLPETSSSVRALTS